MENLCRVGSKVGSVTVCAENIVCSDAVDSGGIVHISLMGQPMIILNSADIMDEFDKRGAIYSDRPVLPMGGGLVGYDQALVLLRYGPRFRTYRKHFSRYIGPNKPIQSLQPMIEHETRKFLRRTLEDHEKLEGHLRKFVCSSSSPNHYLNFFLY